ncbi:tRNA dimethylallyltransferase [Sporomusa ovata DSM 2662]|uniref:tRNA dimethylallyltransferase n=1 Tax=Sporomusa ovata TaxID=2378 RepID=A0A0U1L709_9FIRM|nr:tRNA (adenosine(37)-N6)-dimethylallyltransferase MiaA [Sporomusa ovata]EQB26079.1 tRNA dimethylallyltransferase [Sporomusa ovata DSM 2662]CQR74654.1 tRNA dimethylallyltransferase [Sporomusa ovata]
MNRLIVIIGPTAVGKTKISIDLAKRLDTQIISGDSMLVYRGMDIGTAKPDMREREGIVHHLIDILEPDQEFNVVDFQQYAQKLITQINNDNRIPILAGGTGLYVRALLEGYQFNQAPSDEKLRQKLTELAKQYGNQYLHDLLQQVQPLTAARLHPNDQRRIIRALEVYYLSGETISHEKTATNELLFDAVVIGLTMERAALYERINRRVDQMIEQGLVDEVAGLLQQGVPPSCKAMQGIGYKEIVEYLLADQDLITATDQLKQATRNFAKRQLTFYRRMPYITWYNVDNFEEYNNLLETIYNGIAGKFGVR